MPNTPKIHPKEDPSTTDLLDDIRHAQVLAGENVIIQRLHSRKLCLGIPSCPLCVSEATTPKKVDIAPGLWVQIDDDFVWLCADTGPNGIKGMLNLCGLVGETIAARSIREVSRRIHKVASGQRKPAE